MKRLTGLLATILFSTGAHAAAVTSYYAGNVSYASPDGKTSYGGRVSLVKRTVNPARREITEIVIQSPDKPGDPIVPIVTRIVRRGKTAVFDVSDDGRKFRGTMTFSGPEWKWTRWNYAIEMLGIAGPTGETLSGEGEVTPSEIVTTKVFADASGKSTLLIHEELGRVTAAEFTKLKAEMAAAPRSAR